MDGTYGAIVIGAGISGISAARRLADAGLRVLVLEERGHIGGNAYDHIDDNGVLVHDYGPHIYHTDHEAVHAFLSRFTGWHGYRHRVMADVPHAGGRMAMSVPFDLSSLDAAFGPDAPKLERKLLAAYPGRPSVPVLELMEHPDPDISGVGAYVYEHIFRHYTAKQWGADPMSVDRSVTARVPVRLDRDGGYFPDKYQGLPAAGYTDMLGRMLAHPGIAVSLGADALHRVRLFDGQAYLDGVPFDGPAVYTGQADRLFGYAYGRLPYRALDFRFISYDKDSVLPCGTVNYTMDKDMTRATEFKYLTGQKLPGKTTVCEEYPRTYAGRPGDVPCYPVKNPESAAMYGLYAREAGKYSNLYLLGRLARYEYLDMDDAVLAALELAGRIIAGC